MNPAFMNHEPARVAIVTVTLLLIGCGSALPLPEYASQPSAAFEPVGFAPPPARVEQVPASPRRGAVWLDGEWTWDGSRWAWQPGRWVAPPRGAAYAKWAATRQKDGVLLVAPGSWRTADGKEVAAPPPLAAAKAASDSVVDIDGDPENTAPNITSNEGDPPVK